MRASTSTTIPTGSCSRRPRGSTAAAASGSRRRWRLSRWLFGRDLTWKGAGAEEKVSLDKPVPVYITYLTAVPDGSQIAYLDDVYGRDKARLAGQATPAGAPLLARSAETSLGTR